ncbi:MAG: hypothetical protein LBT08_01525 [Synergistaceae bacterium]|nr:hypothetical protein [Synergistaceae bacterium]
MKILKLLFILVVSIVIGVGGVYALGRIQGLAKTDKALPQLSAGNDSKANANVKSSGAVKANDKVGKSAGAKPAATANSAQQKDAAQVKVSKLDEVQTRRKDDKPANIPSQAEARNAAPNLPSIIEDDENIKLRSKAKGVVETVDSLLGKIGFK